MLSDYFQLKSGDELGNFNYGYSNVNSVKQEAENTEHFNNQDVFQRYSIPIASSQGWGWDY